MKPPSEMTNDEINQACAVEVMGWKLRKDYTDPEDGFLWGDSYWDDDDCPICTFTSGEWNPIKSGDDCFMILDRLQELKFRYLLQCIPLDDQENIDFIFELWSYAYGDYKVFAISSALQKKAICEAAILAVRWLKGQKE